MREWHQPTVEETERHGGNELPAGGAGSRLIRPHSSSEIATAVRRKLGRRSHLGDLSALSPVVDWFPVQDFLMWYQPSFHEWLMTLSS